MPTVAETIKKITRNHLEKNNGLAMGQCLSAVGWVGGTVPEMTQEEGIVELSMADVAGGGIAVGTALSGRRPIYIVRYQGFQWYDCPIIINYAAKAKEMWGVPCPIFVRSIAMEGGIGPVASNSHHSLYTRMPGIPVCAPMTPKEYESIWDYFMAHDDPIYVSEHRRSFAIDYEMPDTVHDQADITILAISATRLNALEAIKQLKEENITCNLIHILWLKPFEVSDKIIAAVNGSKYGALILDGDYENGVLKTIAFDLSQKVNKQVNVLGLEEKAAGFAPHFDNLPPSSDRIINKIKEIIDND